MTEKKNKKKQKRKDYNNITYTHACRHTNDDVPTGICRANDSRRQVPKGLPMHSRRAHNIIQYYCTPTTI